jgi:hypothetical protein
MLNRDFKEFAELLNARSVDYLVIGGYALAAYGHPRYTGDIDFWIRPTAANIARLLHVLTDFGFGSLGLAASDFATESIVQLGQPPRRIDLMTAIDGVSFETCFGRREQVELAGVQLSIIGLDDFKTNKRAAQMISNEALPSTTASTTSLRSMLASRPPCNFASASR